MTVLNGPTAARESMLRAAIRAVSGTIRPPQPAVRRKLGTGQLALLIAVAALNLIGLAMVLSASSVTSLYQGTNTWYHFTRQGIWIALGTVAMCVTWKVDYHFWRRTIPLALALTLAMLVAVLVPGVGVSVNGSSRWLRLGPLGFQPTELLKLTMVLYAADLLARRQHQLHKPAQTLAPILLVFGASSLLVLMQPDLGSVLVAGGVTIGVLFAGGVALGPLAGATFVGGSLAMVLSMTEGYRRDRLLAFLDPWEDPLNTGYQTIQSMVGIANGGVTGVGVGQGRAKWGFLPESHTDFIFAVVAEEMGLVGGLLVLSLFVMIAAVGVRIAFRAPDRFGMLVAIGIVIWMTLQAVVNVGAVVGLLPITGVTLAVRVVRRDIASRWHGRGRSAAQHRSAGERVTGRFAVIAGGGTAGHVHPGLAVAKALVERGHDSSSVLYVGSERGIEHELVPTAGFELVTLPGKGLPRRLSLSALKAGFSLLRGAVGGFRLLGRERPRVVLSLGGFAAVPCAVGARARKIPVVIHEQNAVPGAANRLIGKWAKASAVSFAGTDLPNPVLTGNPVRPEMLAVDRGSDRAEARKDLGVPLDQLLIVVTGGSLGALRLNRAALEAAALWRDRSDITLYHVVGVRDWDALASERAALEDGALDYRPVRYEDNMPRVFAAADVVVSRAGASTTAELAATGLPSVLVPLPGAPGDHQSANASALVDAGGAIMVTDGEFDGHRMAQALEGLMEESGRLAEMSAALGPVGHRDAANRVAMLLEEHAA